jgi:L-2,4-diaminobutyrate decarboxylase
VDGPEVNSTEADRSEPGGCLEQGARQPATQPDGSRQDGLAFFAAPGGLDPRLEDFLHNASSLLCQWLGAAAGGSPLPDLSALPGIEPERTGLGPARLLADLQLVMEGAFHPGHPGALAHLDPPALTASIAADLICAGLNNNLLAEELSPSLSRLERDLCRWLARSLGLGEAAGGVAASGGSLSNLMALVVARHSRGLGICSDAVVLCSSDAHVSLRKAMAVMGLPPQALRRLPVDGRGRLCVAALAAELAGLERRGTPVIAVVATAGTTVRGAIDPLPEIADLCRRRGHWLHVDAAIGGIFALAPGQGARLPGLGLADSLTVNPQKLLGITKTSSLLLLAQPSALPATFGTGLPYMEPSRGGGHGGEIGLQGSRPAEILKLWLGLRQLGLEGIAALVEGALQRRRLLQQLLAADQRLLLLDAPLHLLTFRPRCGEAEALERWSERSRAALLAERLMLSRPVYQGLHHLKAVLGNPHTRPVHLETLAAVLRRIPLPD